MATVGGAEKCISVVFLIVLPYSTVRASTRIHRVWDKFLRFYGPMDPVVRQCKDTFVTTLPVIYFLYYAIFQITS